MSTPKRIRKAAPRWTTEEEERAVSMYKARIPLKEIAAELKRSVVAVTLRINRSIPEANPSASTHPDVIAKVIEGYHRKDTLAKIGKDADVGQKTIRLILQRAGLKKRKKYDVTSVYPPELVAEVIRLYTTEKMRQCAIAKKLNVPYPTVSTILKYRGLKKKPEWWTEAECSYLTNLLQQGTDLWKICTRMNKTDFQVIACATTLGLFEQYPTLHVRLSTEQQEKIEYLRNRFHAFERYDEQRFGVQPTLTFEHVFEMYTLQDGKCLYTGAPLAFRPNNPYTLSIERVDSQLPHTPNNIVLCTWAANQMKQDMVLDIFLEVAGKIASRTDIIKATLAQIRLRQSAVLVPPLSSAAPLDQAA